MKLLLSLYACRPNEGSEPGVGWAWALGMARRHETRVLTRAAYRDRIEAELERLGLPPGERPRFIYCEASSRLRRLHTRKRIPTQLYYLFWQFAARRAYDSQDWRADVIHHVTFNSFQIPGVWWNRREKVVLGPLGGMASCPHAFLRCFSFRGRVMEAMRTLCRKLWWMNPFYMRSRRHADCLVFTEGGVARRIGGPKALPDGLFELAVPETLLSAPDPGSGRHRQRRFIWAGRLEGRKACEIAIRAFAAAFRDVPDPPHFEIAGDGPYRARTEALVKDLGLGGPVVFAGSLPREELWRRFSNSTALVFSSVRDTSGNVVLEALACGTPVVCFNHQGVGEMTDDACAIRVEPTSFERSVCGFAEAMRRLDGDPALADRMGAAGRKRALERFTWERKFDAADQIYRKLLGDDPHA